MADLAIWANTQEENSVKLSDVVFSCEKTFERKSFSANRLQVFYAVFSEVISRMPKWQFGASIHNSSDTNKLH